jgi:hypothetical protein
MRPRGTNDFSGNRLLGDMARAQRGDVTLMQVAAPIRDQQSVVRGALALVINPDREFTRILTVARRGESGETYAFDQTGLLISRSRFDDQLRKIGLLNATNASSALNLRLHDPGLDLTRAAHPVQTNLASQPLVQIIADAVEGDDGVNVEPTRDYRGVSVVAAWQWLPQLGFGVAEDLVAQGLFVRDTRVRFSQKPNGIGPGVQIAEEGCCLDQRQPVGKECRQNFFPELLPLADIGHQGIWLEPDPLHLRLEREPKSDPVPWNPQGTQGREQGYEWFNLGMAPLAGLEQHPLAPAWHRLADEVLQQAQVPQHGEDQFRDKGAVVLAQLVMVAEEGLQRYVGRARHTEHHLERGNRRIQAAARGLDHGLCARSMLSTSESKAVPSFSVARMRTGR